MSYEEERSQIDFDDVVRQNQQKYKEETKLSNQQVGRRSFKIFWGNNIFDKRFLTTSLERRERTDPTSASFSLGQKVRTTTWEVVTILLCVIFIKSRSKTSKTWIIPFQEQEKRRQKHLLSVARRGKMC